MKKKRKNSNYHGASTVQAPVGSKNRTMVVAVAAMIGIIIIAGLILGIVAIARTAGAVVSYDGVSFDKGVTSYLIAYYKNEYLTTLIRNGYDAYDDPEFWESAYLGATSHGDRLMDETVSFLRSMAAGNYLFDRYSSLTKKDKAKLENSIAEVLDYKAEGSKAKFNELAEPMGFNYRDFVVATEIIYKASAAYKIIYGEDGANLAAGADPAGCDEYFGIYSHVKLLFIRTSTEFVIDEDGNRVKDDNGNDTLRDLSDAEKSEREADIAAIDAAINAYYENTDGQMSPEFLDSFYKKYSYDDDQRLLTGYYFSPYSDFSSEFSEAMPGVVDNALGIEVGDYSKVELDFGVCYIYKCENGERDYTKNAYSEFFTDFYEKASAALYGGALNNIGKEIKVDADLGGLDPVYIPYNVTLVAKYS